jgi:hypothetical protein
MTMKTGTKETYVGQVGAYTVYLSHDEDEDYPFMGCE